MPKSKAEFVDVSHELVRVLRLERKMSVDELAGAARVGRTTINNIEHGITQQMKSVNAKRIARALKVSLEDIAETVKMEPRNPALGALGLMEVPASAPDDVPFQSYVHSRDNQPVAFHWTDYPNQALTLKDESCTVSGENRLQIGFRGKQGPLADVVAFHCLDHTPRELLPHQRFLGFGAKIVENPENAELSLAVRLVDRKAREWVLGAHRTFGGTEQAHLFRLDLNKKWTPCVIRLTPHPTTRHRWYLFRGTTADRSPNLRPDWSLLARVVIEIGRVADNGHPGPGNGSILLSPIWIGTQESVEKHLPNDLNEKGSAATHRANRKTKASTKRSPKGR